MPYSVLQSILDEAAPAGMQDYWKSAYISGLSDDVIDAVLSYGQTISYQLSAIHVHHLGGAMLRVGEDATAFGHRSAPFALNIVSSWMDRGESQRHIKWTKDFFDAIEKFSTGFYVNFMGQEDVTRIREAYEVKKYNTLVSLKNKYDPTNFFHMNQNIKPSGPFD